MSQLQGLERALRLRPGFKPGFNPGNRPKPHYALHKALRRCAFEKNTRPAGLEVLKGYEIDRPKNV
jgi:hypothetical protein